MSTFKKNENKISVYSNTPEPTSETFPRFWWSSTLINFTTAYSRLFEPTTNDVVAGWSQRNNGFAVRCVKDAQ
jgi:hypothetical protein